MTKTPHTIHEQRQMGTIVLFVSDLNLQLPTVNIVRYSTEMLGPESSKDIRRVSTTA